MTLKGLILDILPSTHWPQIILNTQACVAKMQLCANHVQHIGN